MFNEAKPGGLQTKGFPTFSQKGLEVCYCPWGVPSRPLAWVLSWARPGPIPGPRWSRPGPSRFAMCFVLQCFGPIQVPRWGPSRPVLVPSCSRAFLTGSGLDGQKQTSWPLPILAKGPACVADPYGNAPCRCFNRPRKRKRTNRENLRNIGSLGGGNSALVIVGL